MKLDDRDLRAIYSGAIALIYPSLYEGFGLPIVEAIACGCPVITCRNSSLSEVAGDAAIYVDEYEITEMIQALEQVQIPEIRQKLIQLGLEQSKKFSWKNQLKYCNKLNENQRLDLVIKALQVEKIKIEIINKNLNKMFFVK
jgi:glycosyltransferase involved in cell wall biosynthesis